MLRLFDGKSFAMSRFYNLPIVVALVPDIENLGWWEIYEKVSEEFHKAFFFTYITPQSFQENPVKRPIFKNQ